MPTAEQIWRIAEKKRDKVLYLLAKGISLRSTDQLIKTDRSTMAIILGSKAKVSFKFADKVAKDILKHKLTIKEVKKKYGQRGLTAMLNYRKLKVDEENKGLMAKIKKLREKDRLSFHKIEAKMGKNWARVRRLYGKSVGKNTDFGNIAFEKARERFASMYKDHQAGLTIKEICTKYHFHPAHVRRILSFNYNVVAIRRQMTPKQIERMVVLRDIHKLQWPAISFIFGVSRSALAYYYDVYHFKGGIKNG